MVLRPLSGLVPEPPDADARRPFSNVFNVAASRPGQITTKGDALGIVR
jgi:hypothetical protein